MTTESENNHFNVAQTADFPPLPSKPSTSNNAVVGEHSQGPAGTRTKLYSRTLTLPVEEQRRPALGEKLVPADIARTVSSLCAVSVDMSSSKLTHTITMVVRGSDERKVGEACRMLRARLAMPVKASLVVPVKAVGVIVGKQGRTIKAIMQETGARITVPQAPSADQPEEDVEVTIEGPGEACADAKRRILAIVDEAVSQVTEHLELPGHTEFFLCGPAHNRSIKHLASEYENIKITHYPSMLILSGDAKLVQPAKEQLTERLVRLNRELKHITTQVPKYLHKHLVGAKGAVLHHIEDVSRCLVVIPSPEDPSDSITIHGMSTDLVSALQMLLEKTEPYHEEAITCPLVIRSYLLHKHRADIKAIEMEHSVQLRPEPSGFVAVGGKASGEAARLAVKKLTQNLGQLQFDTVPVKKDLIKHIIGRQGQGLKALEAEHAVSVIVEEESGPLLILVGDHTDNVVKAKEAVSTFMAQLDNEDSTDIAIAEKYITPVLKHLNVIQDLHPSYTIYLSQKGRNVRIRGPKGILFADCVQSVTMKIKQLEQYTDEHSFQITLVMSEKAKERLSLRTLRTKLALPVDLQVQVDNLKLTLIGRKEEVEAFEQKVDDYLTRLADQDTMTLKLEDDDMIGKLIGKGGKNIATLHHQFQKVNVRFDRDRKQVQLTGPSSAVQQCAAELKNRMADIAKVSNTQAIALPSNAIGRLLSRQAEELAALQKTCSVRISIDHDDIVEDGKKMVKVEGSVERIEECIAKLQQIASEEHEEFLPLTSEQSQLLSHTFQSYFRQYTATLKGTRVFKGDQVLRLKGTPEAVSLAKVSLQQFLTDLTDDSVLSVQVVCIEQSYHGAIIGQRGQNIKKLMLQFDVAIDISKESNEVTVAGRGVAACVEEIMKLAN